jgi:DNA-directed RNA polymerases I, II, and III subunit RPABC5
MYNSKLIIPARRFSYGTMIAHRWDEFCILVSEHDENGNPREGVDVDKILGTLGFTRYCCHRMLFSHVDLIDKLLNYNIYKIGYREM